MQKAAIRLALTGFFTGFSVIRQFRNRIKPKSVPPGFQVKTSFLNNLSYLALWVATEELAHLKCSMHSHGFTVLVYANEKPVIGYKSSIWFGRMGKVTSSNAAPWTVGWVQFLLPQLSSLTCKDDSEASSLGSSGKEKVRC